MNPARRLFNRIRDMGRQSPPPPWTHQANPTRPSTSTVESWTTHDSNVALFECLSTAAPNRPALPTELIFQILDHPTRWVCLHRISYPSLVEPGGPILVVSDRPTGVPVIYTRPFSALDISSLKKIVFTFRSRDQGWCSFPDGGNWSWFEASVVHLPSTDEDDQGQGDDAVEWTRSYKWIGEWMKRHNKRLEDQPRYKIAMNRLASTEPEEHTIELTDEHELLQRVKHGDRVVLWACAWFPGWENRVYEAKITALGIDGLAMENGKDGHS